MVQREEQTEEGTDMAKQTLFRIARSVGPDREQADAAQRLWTHMKTVKLKGEVGRGLAGIQDALGAASPGGSCASVFKRLKE